VQGLANAPVVGPVIREHMKSLPGLKAARVNNTIKMDCGKVVDTVDIEVKEERLFTYRHSEENQTLVCNSNGTRME
jgi:hypothetical protein